MFLTMEILSEDRKYIVLNLEASDGDIFERLGARGPSALAAVDDKIGDLCRDCAAAATSHSRIEPGDLGSFRIGVRFVTSREDLRRSMGEHAIDSPEVKT